MTTHWLLTSLLVLTLGCYAEGTGTQSFGSEKSERFLTMGLCAKEAESFSVYDCRRKFLGLTTSKTRYYGGEPENTEHTSVDELKAKYGPQFMDSVFPVRDSLGGPLLDSIMPGLVN